MDCHRHPYNITEAVAKAVAAGTDLNCGGAFLDLSRAPYMAQYPLHGAHRCSRTAARHLLTVLTGAGRDDAIN